MPQPGCSSTWYNNIVNNFFIIWVIIGMLHLDLWDLLLSNIQQVILPGGRQCKNRLYLLLLPVRFHNFLAMFYAAVVWLCICQLWWSHAPCGQCLLHCWPCDLCRGCLPAISRHLSYSGHHVPCCPVQQPPLIPMRTPSCLLTPFYSPP